MNRVPKRNRAARTPFMLTKTERRVLAMIRSGMTYREVAAALGHKTGAKGNSVAFMVAAACSKERLQVLDDRGSGGQTSLSVARGHVRMDGTK